MARRDIRTGTLTVCAAVGLMLAVVGGLGAQSPSGDAGQAELMELNVKSASVQEVLKLIAETGGFNIAIGEGVEGNITLFMSGIPPRDLLDIVVRVIDAAYVKERLNNGLIRAAAYSVASRAVAQHQLYGVDYYALTGPGLAREDAKAPGERYA